MSSSTATHAFSEGDRVVARTRPGFPDGTVLRLMDLGFLLVSWGGVFLETTWHADVAHALNPVPSPSRALHAPA